MTSEKNEMSLFFRSSLHISGRGFNCSYVVVADEIIKEPSTTKPFNGEGNSFMHTLTLNGHITQKNEKIEAKVKNR